MSINGFLGLKAPCFAANDQVDAFYGDPSSPRKLPTGCKPDYVTGSDFFPFWMDLYVHNSTKQGLYYQITGTAPNRLAHFEWYTSDYKSKTQYYHFLATFREGSSKVTYTYCDISDRGAVAVVGAQRAGTPTMAPIQYSFKQAVIVPGLQLTFNALPGAAFTKGMTSQCQIPTA
jgi:hypothetical protein